MIITLASASGVNELYCFPLVSVDSSLPVSMHEPQSITPSDWLICLTFDLCPLLLPVCCASPLVSLSLQVGQVCWTISCQSLMWRLYQVRLLASSFAGHGLSLSVCLSVSLCVIMPKMAAFSPHLSLPYLFPSVTSPALALLTCHRNPPMLLSHCPIIFWES